MLRSTQVCGGGGKKRAYCARGCACGARRKARDRERERECVAWGSVRTYTRTHSATRTAARSRDPLAVAEVEVEERHGEAARWHVSSAERSGAWFGGSHNARSSLS